MIISIINEKGGSGKTTISVNLACQLSKENIDTLLVDTDPQRSTEAFLNFREANNIPINFSSVSKMGDSLRNEIERFKNKYQTIIIDTGGRDTKEMRQAMLSSDIIIVPTIPSGYDVDALDNMLKSINEMAYLNPKIKAFIIINKASPNPSVAKKIEFLRDFIKSKDLDNFYLAKSVIYEREAYRNAVFDGKGITECEDSKSKKAKNDFLSFYGELLSFAKNIIKE